jgi:2-succinyl-6-hydroxy-2,4-cyclohexadiene-1-carboxylate synthase
VIWCLHGFLGRPSDWDVLGLEHEAPDLHRSAPLPMAAWAAEFNEKTADGDVIVGYSLGGRLALHALLEAADGERRYAAAIIISAGLGVTGESEREARRGRDEAWARRFESEEWADVLRDWNAQPVFGGHSVIRGEGEYDRGNLADALRVWSPGVHAPLRDALRWISVPVLWVAGGRDEVYAAVAREAVDVLPNGTLWICEEAGHRVPWEQPQQFADRAAQFLGVEQRLPLRFSPR